MSKDPDLIRQDIEETQFRMGETVEALAYKADIPSRARDAMNDRVDEIRRSVSGAIASVADAASGAKSTVANTVAGMPTPGAGVRTLRSAAAENPLGVAIGSIAVGFLIGLCLPVSDLERDRVGRLGERMTEQAKTAATDAIEHGKAAVTQALGDAISSAAQPSA
ncbi:MAG: DUF3618 domain-containing protein [Candidatus Cybelea sp.]